MFLTMLKSKLHRGTVTISNLEYEGSIGIDRNLMDAANMLPHERVDVLNINNGERFSTYVIEQPGDSHDIVINGAAARLVQPGDRVIICAFMQVSEEDASYHKPVMVQLDAGNQIKAIH